MTATPGRFLMVSPSVCPRVAASAAASRVLVAATRARRSGSVSARTATSCSRVAITDRWMVSSRSALVRSTRSSCGAKPSARSCKRTTSAGRSRKSNRPLSSELVVKRSGAERRADVDASTMMVAPPTGRPLASSSTMPWIWRVAPCGAACAAAARPTGANAAASTPHAAARRRRTKDSFSIAL